MATTLTACPDIQAELNQYYNTCNASNLREPMPFFDFLMSDANMSGLSQLVVPGPGKIRTVQLTYEQRIPESEVTALSSCDMTCSAETKRGNNVTTYSIDCENGWEVEELVSANDFVYACQSNDQILAKKIQAMIDALVRKTATALTTQAGALLGNWSTDTGVSAGNPFNVVTVDGSGNVKPTGWEDLDLAILQTNFCAAPVIFGGTTIFKYGRLMQAGCCSAQGLDLMAIRDQFGKAVVWDKRVNAITGNDGFWVLQPGALAVITYTGADQGLGMNQVLEGANYRKMTIQDPQSGLPIDLVISDNCGNVSLTARSVAKVVAMPSDMFPVGDSMAGVNFFAEGICND